TRIEASSSVRDFGTREADPLDRPTDLGNVVGVVGRFGISDVMPVVGSTTSAEFPARAVVGEPIAVAATVFREGHDAVAASVVLRDATGRQMSVTRMSP